MNFSWKVLFLFFLIAGCTTSIKTQLPTKPDITNYEIVTGLQADSLTKYAAKELQSYLQKIFKKPFAIQKNIQPGKSPIRHPHHRVLPANLNQDQCVQW